MTIYNCAKKLKLHFPAILLLAIAPAFVSRVQAAAGENLKEVMMPWLSFEGGNYTQ